MSVDGSEFMITLLGWILFLLTLQIAIWRDVVRQKLTENRAREDVEYLLQKQHEWQADSNNLLSELERLKNVNQELRAGMEAATLRDLDYLIVKQEEWRIEKQNLKQVNKEFAAILENVRRAVRGFEK
jgi:DNA repair exonuclease SbcCD ATPase subunit